MTKETLKQIRHKAGLTQQQFADALDVSKRTVEEWEGGRRSPGRRSLKDIQKFLEEREG